MLKVLTAPVWLSLWAVAMFFKARSVVRTGRRQAPVRVVLQTRPVVVRVYLSLQALPPLLALPPPSDSGGA